jgi:DNA-directed RNA polymerase subunit D
MNIEIREKDEEKAVFVVEGVDDTFINTIRRICLVEIPTLAIEDVNIFKNDAKMFDEVLAHRLGLIPIKTDLKSYVFKSDCGCDSHCSSCSVSFLLKEKGPKVVYSKDLKSDDPAIKPVYDTINRRTT